MELLEASGLLSKLSWESSQLGAADKLQLLQTWQQDHSSQLGISLMANVSSLGKATASPDPELPTPKPTNSGPIFVTAVAPMISRYFKFGSCPIGGRCTLELQFMSLKYPTEGK
ncbi:unnamed protein product [Urochloa humidicola]